MAKLTKPITLETAFGLYTIDETVGEGGAGRVYGGSTAANRTRIAIKVLSNATMDKRARFKNEIAFLAKNKHPNIVSVIDHGVANAGGITGPFYVMRRYDGNLRDLMKGKLPPQEALQIFGKILDGVEAAHLSGAVHRDLKPENVLYDQTSKTPAVADFGVASFTDELMATTVETGPTQRLANFMYAAPEQRVPGANAGIPADIWALGLMLNELFTSRVPHGTEFEIIGKSHSDFGYLDTMVAKMMRQAPGERFESIAELKAAIAAHHSEFLSLQRISKINGAVIPAEEVDEPLAHEPPKLVGAEWTAGTLVLTLDRPVNQNWINALHNMGSYSNAMGCPPRSFQFRDREARVQCQPYSVQQVIDHFKTWLPQVTWTLKHHLENEARLQQSRLQDQLRRERAAEEERLRVNKALKI